MRLGILFALVFLICCTCAAQSVSVGVVDGARITDDVLYVAVPESKRYVVGPSVEVGFFHGLAIEFDALYHRHGYSIRTAGGLYYVNERERANS